MKCYFFHNYTGLFLHMFHSEKLEKLKRELKWINTYKNQNLHKRPHSTHKSYVIESDDQ